VEMGMTDVGVLERIESLIDSVGLPTRAKDLPADDALIAAMQSDKKVANDELRLVIPTTIGAVEIVDRAPPEAVRAGWARVRNG